MSGSFWQAALADRKDLLEQLSSANATIEQLRETFAHITSEDTVTRNEYLAEIEQLQKRNAELVEALKKCDTQFIMSGIPVNHARDALSSNAESSEQWLAEHDMVILEHAACNGGAGTQLTKLRMAAGKRKAK